MFLNAKSFKGLAYIMLAGDHALDRLVFLFKIVLDGFVRILKVFVSFHDSLILL